MTYIGQADGSAAGNTPDAASSALPAIELRDVYKAFTLENGETISAANGVSLSVAPGEFIAVIGPSGHGKSTLLNLVAGFLQADSGDVRAHGSVVTGPGSDRGVLFQKDTLFNWMKVRANVEFGLRARGFPPAERRRISDRLLDLVGLSSYADAWPKQLSGGMRRRAAIAAVFANEPDVLLMDEPFTGLDYARRKVLYSVLYDLWQRSGNTVFCVTHDLDEALAMATRIVVVVKGQIVVDRRLDKPYPRTPETLVGDDVNAIRVDVMHHLETALVHGGGASRDK